MAKVIELATNYPPPIPGRSFFPHLISAPFRDGLHAAFIFAILACLIAAAASLMRGGRYQHVDEPSHQRSALDRVPQLKEQHAR